MVNRDHGPGAVRRVLRRTARINRGHGLPCAAFRACVEGTRGPRPLLRVSSRMRGALGPPSPSGSGLRRDPRRCYVLTVDAMCFLHGPSSERDTPRRGPFFFFIGAMRPARGPPSRGRRDTLYAQSAVPLSSARCAPRVVRCVSSLCVGVMRFAQSACRLLGAMRSTRGPPGVCLWGGRCCRAGACAWCLVRGRACVVAVLQSRWFDCRGFLVSGSGHGLHFMITILPSRSKHT
jgi:hypothetical protein